MSADQNSKKPVVESIKDAEVVSTPGNDGLPPAAKPIPFVQQLFIWAMILLVGVIFGVGSSWTFLQHSPRAIGGVIENDIIIRKGVAERLQDILAESGERFAANSYEQYAEQIRLARYAASKGLEPEGSDLDRVVDDFLAKTLPGGTRTYRDLLVEHQGTKGEVTRPELRLYLSERSAIEALFARNLAAPAVPLTVADDIDRMRRTKISADEVTLDASHLLVAVADNDPGLQSTYDRLRASRFTRQAQVVATVAAADFAALTAKAVIGEAEIQTWYDSHKESYRKPLAPGAKSDAAPEYKALADVSAEIKTMLARQQAEKSAQDALNAFNSVIETKDLERADAATFAAAAKAAGLVVTPGLSIAEPQSGMVDLGTLGRIKDPAGIFAKDPGFITNPLQAAGDDRTWFVLRVDSKSPAGFKSLDEVKDEVKKAVSGERAYKALREQVELLRVAAEKAGPGGLKKVMADPANAVWKATPSERTLHPLDELKVPATDVGGAAGEPVLAASLTLPERPVTMAEADGEHAVPTVRLVQVREVTRDDTSPAAPAERMSGAYRDALTGYRRTQFDRELRDQLGK
jgi:hypothetical protein